MPKTKTQKEYQDILNAIKKWSDKNNGDVCFVTSFVAFDKDEEVKDEASGYCGYGAKSVIKIGLEELEAQIRKEKKEFINW